MAGSATIPPAVLQAKLALKFQPKVNDNSTIEVEKSNEKAKLQGDNLDSQLNVRESSDVLRPGQLIRQILDGQDRLSEIKAQEEKNNLEAEWSNPFGNPKLAEQIYDISVRLEKVLDEKESLLETLRHPIAENSIPWRRERQLDVVESFKLLKLLSDDKDTNRSNADWINNQDWSEFATKQLPALETEVLRLEAELANRLKECKQIKGSVEKR